MGVLDMPFEDIKGSLSNWVTTKSIQEEIKRRFRAFLEAYKDEAEELVYKKRVRDMCVGENHLHTGFYPAIQHEMPLALGILSKFRVVLTLHVFCASEQKRFVDAAHCMHICSGLQGDVMHSNTTKSKFDMDAKQLLCPAGQQQSLLVDLKHLGIVEMDIALWLQCQPKIVMELLNEVAKEYVLKEFPEYGNIHEDIFVRLEASIEENIRDLRCGTRTA